MAKRASDKAKVEGVAGEATVKRGAKTKKAASEGVQNKAAKWPNRLRDGIQHREGYIFVTLRNDRSERLWENLWVEARSSGNIVIAGQDLGPVVLEHFGDSDYEYWLTIEAKDKRAVYAHLFADFPQQLGDPGDYSDEALLLAFEKLFPDEFLTDSDVRDWLFKHGIVADFDCWV